MSDTERARARENRRCPPNCLCEGRLGWLNARGTGVFRRFVRVDIK